MKHVRIAVALTTILLMTSCAAQPREPGCWFLPPGLEDVRGCGTDAATGLPLRIRCVRDGAEMILIPGGEFLFGPDKQTKHEGPFYIDRLPVTNAQFARFVKRTGHKPGRCICGCCWIDKQDSLGPWLPKAFPAEFPAVNVTWIDALAYCRWTGKELPTETRWEKAARGTDGRLYPWGKEPKPEVNPETWTIHKAGAAPETASPYGIEDMLGGVWELAVGWGERRTHFAKPPQAQALIVPQVSGVTPPEGHGFRPVLRGGGASCFRPDDGLPDEVWRRLTYGEMMGAMCNEGCLQGHGVGPNRIGFRCVLVPCPPGQAYPY